MSRLKFAFAIIFIKLIICTSYKIDIFDTSRLDENGKPSLLETVGDYSDFQHVEFRDALRTHHGEIRRTNIFEDFVMSMLDLLMGYPGRMLSRYCRVVYRELDRLEYRYTRKLANHFRELSTIDRNELRVEMRQYKEEMQKKTPQLKAFISHMNELFTMEQGVKFRDYVLDVRDYGNYDKKDVVYETREVLDSIIKVIKKLSTREQNELEKKMRRAVREHNINIKT